MINLTTILQVPMASQDLQRSARQLVSIADEYRKDPNFRSNLSSDPVAALAENGIEVRPDSEVRVVEDTDEAFHFVFPPDFNAGLGDEVLDTVAGGGKSAAAQPAPQHDRRIIRTAASGSWSTMDSCQ